VARQVGRPPPGEMGIGKTWAVVTVW
jgi:hypothetical protein